MGIGPRRVGFLAVFAASMAIGRGEATGRPDAASTSPAADPLIALNDHFHDAYRRARLEKLARTGPVVLVGFQSLALIRQGARAEVPFPPAIYQKLKEVSHVPLMDVRHAPRAPSGPAVRRGQDRPRSATSATSSPPRSTGSTAAGFPRLVRSTVVQSEILRLTQAYLAGVLRDGKAPADALDAFRRAHRPADAGQRRRRRGGPPASVERGRWKPGGRR